MIKIWIQMVIVCIAFYTGNAQEKREDFKSNKVVDYVDPFIGTGGHGHTFPGATYPFGMIQLSPDNGKSGWDWCSGYHYPDNFIAGFSHLHLSGTGIGDLADILFMPVDKKINLTKPIKNYENAPYRSAYSHNRESAYPGYYQVFLNDYHVNVELTASKRTGYQKYTFKKEDKQSVIIDLGFHINWDKPTKTALSLEGPTTISGYRFSTGWAKNQKVFFVAKFSKPVKNAIFLENNQNTSKKAVEAEHTSAQLFFDEKTGRELEVRVSLSSVSIQNAKENMDSGHPFGFDKAKRKTEKKWKNALQKIKVETPVDSLKTIFYTALYHSKMSPVTFSDKNREFRLENDSIVKAKNYTAYSTLSLWDTFRAEQPLLTLTNPQKVSGIINSMLMYYNVHKKLPVWTLYANETNTMTGYHSIPVIAEAYAKGIRGFDIEKAYRAMKTTMMQDDRGLKAYKKYGYAPYDLVNESVTITLEYAYDDWCVAQIAKALGKNKDYQYFLKRSKAYKYLYDPKTGFMRGKSKDGIWHAPFDPKFSRHRHNTDYTEGNAWQHSWFVPQDPKDLIKLHGGKKKFITMLEQLFTESSEIKGKNSSSDISGLIGQYAHGNEPSHHIAYLFNEADAPWKTQYWVHEILEREYNTTPKGLSGNEDAGQMSAWYVFSSLGLYPLNPASGNYEIGTPLFKKAIIKLANHKKFSIIAKNVSKTNFYIQSAVLNGKPLETTTLSHQQILKGGTLKFVMGPRPNKNWGTK